MKLSETFSHTGDGTYLRNEDDRGARANLPSAARPLCSPGRYLKELSRITQSKNLPPEWATPAQRSRAVLKALKK